MVTDFFFLVSNLISYHLQVVEASQDFVPLLLLTADRPPELQNAGANQAINQVWWFYTTFLLTDEKIHFTKRGAIEHSHASNSIQLQVEDLLNTIQCANKGLLLIGAIHTEDEAWAALLLAKHLSWPIVADILSGLRLKKVFTAFPQFTEKMLFIDHLDHALLADSVKLWAQPDVIIQVAREIEFQIHSVLSLTEPHVAQGLESGIDGLLSTAIGFATGSYKR
ncbi:hypothetical protein IFM89_015565, partial [Coptis chinensis]